MEYLIKKYLAPWVLQGSSCGGVRANGTSDAGHGLTILLYARTLAYLVDDKESYAGPYDTESNNTHDLHPGIRVSCNFVIRGLMLLPRREKELTDCVFHPVWTMACLLLYLFTVSVQTRT